MAMVMKTRNMIEGLVREGSFRWLLTNRALFDEDFEEISNSPSARRNWISELSPVANIVVRRCSRILGISMNDLQENFNCEASDSVKHPSQYARNFLEYCSFRSLALCTQVTGHLADKKFRRLTFDIMLAWEAPAASCQATLDVSEDATVGIEAFSRIAPSVPTIANVVISDNLFEVLTASTSGRLRFWIYEKYLVGLDRAVRKLKVQSESSLLSATRAIRGEKILEVDGTVTTQPVLEHIGISAWPGRLTLTDHALYFESHLVVSFDKPKQYDLADDLKQAVKPELTGPWGTRLFDKAVLYKSIALSEPVVLEFPELKGHARRDYWLAIIREILLAHRFINKFEIQGVERDEALSKAVLGVLRLQAIHEINTAVPLRNEALLMFNLCDQLPGGDLILDTLANLSKSWHLDRGNSSSGGVGMNSISAMDMVSNLGFSFGTSANDSDDTGLVVGEVSVGKMTSLEKAVKESKSSYRKVIRAQATVDGVKVEGVDTNLAVMQELLFPVVELGKLLLSLLLWDDVVKSSVFCVTFTYIIYRGWIAYACALMLILIAVFMNMTRFFNQGRPVDELKVTAPPSMNKMEQLLAVQNVISQAEEFIQDGNVVLLKIRGLLFSIFPQASEKFAITLVVMALFLVSVPTKYVVLVVFLQAFTMFSPPRKANTERWMRRLREWWFSIPAAPVVLEGCDKEDKKRKLYNSRLLL